MPQASEELRKQFFEYDAEGNIIGDGIAKAEKIIIDAGGTISNDGSIYIRKSVGDDPLVDAAINFLCNEWDYGFAANKFPLPVENIYVVNIGEHIDKRRFARARNAVRIHDDGSMEIIKFQLKGFKERNQILINILTK